MKAILLSSCLLLSHASAAIIYSGTKNIAIPTTPEGIYLNLDLGTYATSEFQGWDVNPFFGGFAVGNSSDFQPVRDGTGNTDTLVTIPAGSTINASLNYSSGNGGSSDHMNTVSGGTFVPGQSAYIGFRFTPDAGGATRYGWMRVIFTVNQPGGLIQDWAWENSGTAIQAGAVPEPSAAWLAVAGSLALFRRRRPAR